MPLVLFYRLDIETLVDMVERHRATFTVASITAFIALMNHPEAHERDLSSFAKLYSGGAPIAPTTEDAYEALFGTYIHSVYGLTETTSPSHMVPFGSRAPVDPSSGVLAVGLPIFNTRSAIVDEDHRELAAGDVGEIAISGPQVVPAPEDSHRKDPPARASSRLEPEAAGVSAAAPPGRRRLRTSRYEPLPRGSGDQHARRDR